MSNYTKGSQSETSTENGEASGLNTLDTNTISETPVWPINWKEMLSLFPVMIKSGLPIAVTSIANYLIPTVSMMFVGTYGTTSEYAAISLGNTFSNVYSVGVFGAINQGFGVMASQFYGAKKYKEVGLLLQRNLFVLAIVAIFSTILMIYTDHALIHLGVDPEVSMNVGLYLRYLLPSAIGLNIFDCLRCYLTSLELFFFQGAVQFVASIMHVFWCWFFVVNLGMSIRGAALAKSASDLSAALILLVYAYFNRKVRKCSVPWTRKCIKGWRKHLKDSFEIGGNMYISSIFLEASLLIVGILNNAAITGAHGSVLSLANAFGALIIGNCTAVQTYVGNCVGERSKYKAQKVIVVGLVINTIYSLINTAIMLIFTRELAGLFSSDPGTIEIFSTMLVMHCVVHLIDNEANLFSYVLRTVGKEFRALVYAFISYVVLGITSEYFFGIYLGYGYVGIWVCILVEMVLECVLVGRDTLLLDWHKIIDDIQEKIDNQVEIDENKLPDLEEKCGLLTSEDNEETNVNEN